MRQPSNVTTDEIVQINMKNIEEAEKAEKLKEKKEDAKKEKTVGKEERGS